MREDVAMLKTSTPPRMPRNVTYPRICEDDVISDVDDVTDGDCADSLEATPGKPPIAPGQRKQRVGLHRSHTWTACDAPCDRNYAVKRKTDSLRQGLLSRRHRQSLSLQNVFCLVKETSINSVKTLIKLFEMNVVSTSFFSVS